MKIRLIRTCGLSFLAIILLLSTSQLAFGQAGQGGPRPKQGGPTPEDDAAAAAACVSCCGGWVLVIVVSIVIFVLAVALNIALLIWVAKDAKNRNMDSAVMWMILVMFTGVVGLIIYIFSRPQGNLMRCDECGNSRLQASRKCPHCGNA